MGTIITKNMTVNDVMTKHPDAAEVFNRFRIATCCAGAETIEAVAIEGDINLDSLLQALNGPPAREKPRLFRRG